VSSTSAPSITFELRPFDQDCRQLVPVVGADLLSDLVTDFERTQAYEPAGGYGGLVLEYYKFGDLARYLVGEQTPWPGARVPLLGCACGDWGCWPLVANVSAAEGFVSWDAFAQPHRPGRDYSGFGPFRFDEASYRHAAQDAADTARA